MDGGILVIAVAGKQLVTVLSDAFSGVAFECLAIDIHLGFVQGDLYLPDRECVLNLAGRGQVRHRSQH